MCSFVSHQNVMLTCVFFFFQAEDGIRDLVRSRGLGDVYKRQMQRIGHGEKVAEMAKFHATVYHK